MIQILLSNSTFCYGEDGQNLPSLVIQRWRGAILRQQGCLLSRGQKHKSSWRVRITKHFTKACTKPSTRCVSTAAEMPGLLSGETGLRVYRGSVAMCAGTRLMECTDRLALCVGVLGRGACIHGRATMRRLSIKHRHTSTYDTSSLFSFKITLSPGDTYVGVCQSDLFQVRQLRVQ